MPLFPCSLVIICIFLTEIHVCNWCILYFVYVLTRANQRLKSLAEKNKLEIQELETAAATFHLFKKSHIGTFMIALV